MSDFPLSSAHLIGWVLRRQRLRVQSVSGLDKSAFLALLRDQGIKVDASRLSRWELGRLSPGMKVLAAYEPVCGLPTYTLRALATEAHRVAGTDFINVVDAGSSHGRAHQVLDMTLAGVNPPSGELFEAIGQAFLQDRLRYLSPLMAERVAQILVSRLDIAQSHDRITNRAAVRAAARHPRLRRALSRELVDRSTQAHAGMVSEALEMLLRLDSKSAVPVLVALLSPDGDPDTCLFAACHARHALMSSALDVSSRRRLKAALLEFRSTVTVSRPLGQVMDRRSVHDVLYRHLARAEDEVLLDDERSSILVSTALWHDDLRHQHLASLAMISGDVSPGLAPALVELSASGDEALALRASVVLEYLPDPPAVMVEQAVPLVADPVIARQLWRARGHADVPLECGAAVEAALDDEGLASSVLYALAMSGSSDLEHIATDLRRPIGLVGRTKWWLEHGPDRAA